jgi:uncharacterized protein (TIGR03435 family)
MQELDDIALLRQYAEHHSEEAFAELVARHINKVYSAALRHTRNPHQAEEITQAVFVILAKKAGGLSRNVILSGWLYQTARLTSVTFLRSEIRRARREQEAHMQRILDEPAVDETWHQIAPLLDAAMAKLSETDRHAVVLRFFDGKSMSEVGAALGATEEAAKKRVNRALEKLQQFFARRGVNSSTAIIAGAMSSNSVQLAPAALAKSVTAIAFAKGATAGSSTLTLVKGALKIMAWTKTQSAIALGIAAILAATGTVVVKEVVYSNASMNDSRSISWANDPRHWQLNNPKLESYPPVFILRPTHFAGHGGGIRMLGLFNDLFLEKDVSVQDLVADAYGFTWTRIVFPPDLAQESARKGYDLMLTVPNSKKVLRDAIQKQFGLVGHPETIVTNVLLVRVANPDAPGLKLASSSPRQQPGWFQQKESVTLGDQRLDTFLGAFIESQVQQPVFNETGLTGRYNLHIEWHPQAGETEQSAFERALQEQLGLELVSATRPVEMLIVEKAAE